MDTVAMARQEREKNGPWEAEVSYGGEVDLHRHLDGCIKNPGHLKFIPVDLFDRNHLPSGYQDDLLVEMIRAVSDLTVRVSVKYVSEERPETFPGSDKPYPCYKNRGSDMMSVGTGWVGRIDMYQNETCDCKECQNSSSPKSKFAHILIHTAAHVVFDHLEGAHTTCHLFFDRDGTPDLCKGVIALTGMSSTVSDMYEDLCGMTHVTHDLGLARRLKKMVSRQQKLEVALKAKYINIYYHPPINDEHKQSEHFPLEKLIIIVSHPHGCSKQVSVGYSTDIDDSVDYYIKFRYTATTCPGSSGAPVCLIWEWVGHFLNNHAHSGNCEGNNELNFSSWT